MLGTAATPPETGRNHVGPTSRTHLPEEPPELVIAFAEPEPGVLVVRVSGELNLATAPQLDDRVQHELDWRQPQQLILDLHRIRFLGLQGVAVFERIRRRAATAHARVHLARLSATGVRTLDFAGILPSFERCPDVAAALAIGRAARDHAPAAPDVERPGLPPSASGIPDRGTA